MQLAESKYTLILYFNELIRFIFCFSRCFLKSYYPPNQDCREEDNNCGKGVECRVEAREAFGAKFEVNHNDNHREHYEEKCVVTPGCCEVAMQQRMEHALRTASRAIVPRQGSKHTLGEKYI